MSITSAHVLYAPFRRKPFGHVSVVFIHADGEDTVISAEAELPPGTSFSMVQGLTKSYRLRYVIEGKDAHLDRYRRDRRTVRTYPLDLTVDECTKLYYSMSLRAKELENSPEWYHTLMNSCITNFMRHLDFLRPRKHLLLNRWWLILAPSLIRRQLL